MKDKVAEVRRLVTRFDQAARALSQTAHSLSQLVPVVRALSDRAHDDPSMLNDPEFIKFVERGKGIVEPIEEMQRTLIRNGHNHG